MTRRAYIIVSVIALFYCCLSIFSIYRTHIAIATSHKSINQAQEAIDLSDSLFRELKKCKEDKNKTITLEAKQNYE